MGHNPRVAIVHDYLNQYGGAERVLELLHQIYPVAPVYTIVHDPSKVPAAYRGWEIRSSFINRLPGVRDHYEKYFFLYPRAVESFDLSRFDLVISSSSAWAKGAVTSKDAFHVCYLYSAMRFVWDWRENVLREHGPLIRPVLNRILEAVKKWDIRTARNPDLIIVDSQEVQGRVKRYYGRETLVLNPAVDTEYFRPGGNGPGDYYLVVARLKPYKRVDIAVEAFNKTGRQLIIAGDGPEYKALLKAANDNITFAGKVSDSLLLELYQNCRALVFTPLEDFGIVPLEAQACGRPVIAFGKGGARETVIDRRTGLFFHRQDPESLLEAVEEFEGSEFSSAAIREHAVRFDKKIFIEKFRAIVEQGYQKHRGGQR
ncbi:MAG: glycosyltransferase [Candidatus Edwardsbacteria bacterium]|nr:glycosyltransferase [Candidatus Edwardsbacteria bacterium]